MQRIVERSVYLVGLAILAAFCKIMTMRAGMDVWWFFDLALAAAVVAALGFNVAMGYLRGADLVRPRAIAAALLLGALATGVTLGLMHAAAWAPWPALAAGLSAACVAWAVAG